MSATEATVGRTGSTTVAWALVPCPSRGRLWAYPPVAPRGSGRLDRKVCSLTVSPFSALMFS